jgi:hypothetical protein
MFVLQFDCFVRPVFVLETFQHISCAIWSFRGHGVTFGFNLSERKNSTGSHSPPLVAYSILHQGSLQVMEPLASFYNSISPKQEQNKPNNDKKTNSSSTLSTESLSRLRWGALISEWCGCVAKL